MILLSLPTLILNTWLSVVCLLSIIDSSHFFVQSTEQVSISSQGTMNALSSLPKAMRAVVAEGGRCVVTERPLPVLRDGEILIKVAYSALNRADTLQRKGGYNPPPGATDILGLEASGVVVAHKNGTSTDKFPIGSKAMALLPGGGYAQYVSISAAHAMPVLENLSLRVAGGIPETWLTAYQLLHFVGKLKENDTILVHAAGSGVGTSLIQLARLFGATVIASAGTDDKLKMARALGAQYLINYKNESVGDKVLEYTNNKGVDLILDPIGASMWRENAKAITVDGRWVLYANMGGAEPEGPFLGHLLRKRVQFTATTLRNRDDAYKAKLISEFAKNALPYMSSKYIESLEDAHDLVSGFLYPVIDKEFSIDEAQEAQEYMESNQNIGKIMLRVDGSLI